MNKEKVRELVTLVYSEVFNPNREDVVMEWFEQNPVEPVVVGLSDEQIIILGEVIRSRPNESETLVIHDWLKTQTFAQPEPIVVGLTEEHIRAFTKEQFPEWAEHAFVKRILDWQKTQTFAQPEPVVVGLTEEQVFDLACEMEGLKDDSRYQYDTLIKRFLKTQTFAQQFTPDWSTAPSWANWLAQDLNGKWVFFEDEPENYSCTNRWIASSGRYHVAVINKNWKETLQQRPKPTPQVEVGQVWRSNDNHEIAWEMATVIGVDDEAIAYRSNAKRKIGVFDIADFLAKFEQVQS